MLSPRLPRRIINSVGKTLRPVNPGAEKWLYRPISCLDHGFVYLVDYLGTDSAIAEAARVSYGKGTKKVSEDRTLIRHLLRHAHTSPFEMCEIKLHCKMPIFVARQWIRHRTASVNEYSARYSEMVDEFYLPDPSVLRKQSASNKQGRGEEELTPDQQARVLQLLKREYKNQYSGYKEMLDSGLTRELARIGLSVANYTQWYWKIDLHNLLHFLRLRLDSHAQYEIRVFGDAIAKVLKDSFPITFEAFEDYRLNSVTLSGPDIEILKALGFPKRKQKKRVLDSAMERFQNKRESQEFVAKLKKLGLLK